MILQIDWVTVLLIYDVIVVDNVNGKMQELLYHHARDFMLIIFLCQFPYIAWIHSG
jgi:hypothetical protein